MAVTRALFITLAIATILGLDLPSASAQLESMPGVVEQPPAVNPAATAEESAAAAVDRVESLRLRTEGHVSRWAQRQRERAGLPRYYDVPDSSDEALAPPVEEAPESEGIEP